MADYTVQQLQQLIAGDRLKKLPTAQLNEALEFARQAMDYPGLGWSNEERKVANMVFKALLREKTERDAAKAAGTAVALDDAAAADKQQKKQPQKKPPQQKPPAEQPPAEDVASVEMSVGGGWALPLLVGGGVLILGVSAVVVYTGTDDYAKKKAQLKLRLGRM